MEVEYCPEAEVELAALPPGERVAMLDAIESLNSWETNFPRRIVAR